MPTRATSALDHPNRPHPGNFAREIGAMHDFHYEINILVSVGLFFSQPFPTPRTSDNAFCRQLLIDAAALGVLHRRGATHEAPGAVTCGAKRLLHAATLADQDPACPPHVTG